MAKKMDYTAVAYVLRDFTKAGVAKYGDMAWSTGYYESMIAEMIANLPRKDQESYMARMASTKAKYLTKAVEVTE